MVVIAGYLQLSKFKDGLVKHKITAVKRYWTLEVGKRYRLFSKDSGVSWRLCKHSTYDKELQK